MMGGVTAPEKTSFHNSKDNGLCLNNNNYDSPLSQTIKYKYVPQDIQQWPPTGGQQVNTHVFCAEGACSIPAGTSFTASI